MNLYELLKKPTKLLDSHSHINSSAFDADLDFIIKKDPTLEIWDVSTDFDSITESLNISKKYNKVKSFIGIDPEVFIPNNSLFIGLEVKNNWFDNCFEKLDKIITQNRDYIVGVGETGLDFYWTKNLDNASATKSHSLQKQLFELHIELANKHILPLTIHSRGAETECIDIMWRFNAKGIFHSYTGDYKTSAKILDSGCGLGVNGIITFKNGNNVRETYRRILGKVYESQIADLYKKGIYFETDAPYLSPEGSRGQRNEPTNVKNIYNYFKEFIHG